MRQKPLMLPGKPGQGCMYHVIYNDQKLGKKSRCLKRKRVVKIIKPCHGKIFDEIVK